MLTICEFKNPSGEWHEIGTSDAIALAQSVRKRCKFCHGQVHLYPATIGSSASAPHFGHNEAHPGCPNSLHPNAIE